MIEAEDRKDGEITFVTKEKAEEIAAQFPTPFICTMSGVFGKMRLS